MWGLLNWVGHLLYDVAGSIEVDTSAGAGKVCFHLFDGGPNGFAFTPLTRAAGNNKALGWATVVAFAPPQGGEVFELGALQAQGAGLKLANPLMTASGTCGYADEYADFVDLRQLGAFVTKSITLAPRVGNDYRRVVETRAGSRRSSRGPC
jgi:hypothetical protein